MEHQKKKEEVNKKRLLNQIKRRLFQTLSELPVEPYCDYELIKRKIVDICGYYLDEQFENGSITEDSVRIDYDKNKETLNINVSAKSSKLLECVTVDITPPEGVDVEEFEKTLKDAINKMDVDEE